MPVLNTSNTSAIFITIGKKEIGIRLDDEKCPAQSLWKT